MFQLLVYWEKYKSVSPKDGCETNLTVLFSRGEEVAKSRGVCSNICPFEIIAINLKPTLSMGTIMCNIKTIFCDTNWKSVVLKAYIFSVTKILINCFLLSRWTFPVAIKTETELQKLANLVLPGPIKHTMSGGWELLPESFQFCIWMGYVGVGGVKRFVFHLYEILSEKTPYFCKCIRQESCSWQPDCSHYGSHYFNLMRVHNTSSSFRQIW